MGSHKNKTLSQNNVKKRKQSAGESYESSDSESETQQPTSPTLLRTALLSRKVARRESNHGRSVSFRH